MLLCRTIIYKVWFWIVGVLGEARQNFCGPTGEGLRAQVRAGEGRGAQVSTGEHRQGQGSKHR